MKKWTYLLSGIIIGALVATTGSAFAAEIKSLIGQKVTGEYTVVVNGKKLAEKGAVVDGRTNVPARSISEALGADVTVSENVINITSKSNISSNVTENGENPYMGLTKKTLEINKDIIENQQLKRNIESRDRLVKEYEEIKKADAERGIVRDKIGDYDESIAEREAAIAKYTKELELINEALAALK